MHFSLSVPEGREERILRNTEAFLESLEYSFFFQKEKQRHSFEVVSSVTLKNTLKHTHTL